MFILKITGLLVLKSQSLALRSSAFSALYFKHLRCFGFQDNISSILFCKDSRHKSSFSCWEGRRLFLLQHHFVNFVAFCFVSREKLCHVEYACSIQVRIVHSLLPTETKTFCFGNKCKSAFLVCGLLPFPSGFQSGSRDRTLAYQKHDRKEHSSLAQAVRCICSRKVWARCAALSETDFIAVYILFPALICSFLACP